MTDPTPLTEEYAWLVAGLVQRVRPPGWRDPAERGELVQRLLADLGRSLAQILERYPDAIEALATARERCRSRWQVEQDLPIRAAVERWQESLVWAWRALTGSVHDVSLEAGRTAGLPIVAGCLYGISIALMIDPSEVPLETTVEHIEALAGLALSSQQEFDEARARAAKPPA
jgi:hypothetical protein